MNIINAKVSWLFNASSKVIMDVISWNIFRPNKVTDLVRDSAKLIPLYTIRRNELLIKIEEKRTYFIISQSPCGNKRSIETADMVDITMPIVNLK